MINRSCKARGQISLEYILLFSVLAGATLIGMTQWDDRIRASFEQLFLRLSGAL